MILEHLDSGKLYGFDTDPQAQEYAAKRLLRFGNKFEVIKDNFSNLKEALSKEGVASISGIVYDLGVSSRQFDTTVCIPGDWTVLVQTSHSWHGGVDFLVRTNFNIPEPKLIVIACNTEFETTWLTIWHFFRRNPAHAVGYSDGTTGFIPSEQYVRLDRTGLVPLSVLVAKRESAKSNE